MAVLLLAGCASTPIAVKPNESRVIVAVPCNTTIPEKPQFAFDALAIGADIWSQVVALLADREQRKGYEKELEAALVECVDTDKLKNGQV